MSDRIQFAVDPAWSEVAACVDEYERLAGDSLPDLRSVLSSIGPKDSEAAILELIRTDMEYRVVRDIARPVEDYLREFPEIASRAGMRDDLDRALGEAQKSTVGFPSPAGSTTAGGPVAAYDTQPVVQGIEDTVVDSETPEVIGDFVIGRSLGEGSFGRVLLAIDTRSGRHVAVKIAHEHLVSVNVGRMIDHEARGAGRLDHAHIVPLVDCGVLEDGRPYLIYEYVPGETLADRLRKGDVDLDQRIRWVADIADALHHAHLEGLVHRDVKPSNVLIDERDHAWLTDFGLALIGGEFFADDSNRVLGTLSYMSPEQASSRSHWATPQSDVYAVGIVLYEALCGRLPFVAKSENDLREQIVHRHPAAPRSVVQGVDPELEAICLRALKKDPADRHQTAGDLAQALRDYLDPPPAAAEPWRRAVSIGAGLAAILASVSLSWAVLTMDPDAAPVASGPLPGVAIHLTDPTGVRPYADPFNPEFSAGQEVHVRADCAEPGYTYVAAFATGQQPVLLAHPDADDPTPAKKTWGPPRDDVGYVLPDGDGVAAFAVGVSQTELTAEQVASFLAMPVGLPEPSERAEYPLCVADPEPPEGQAEPPQTTRGSASAADYNLGSEIEPHMSELFDSFHVRAFSYFER